MKNGTIWLDDQGDRIQAHGGCIIEFKGNFYWYGEYKGVDNIPGKRQTPLIGVSCYSSKDFKSWCYEGLVLKAQEDEESDLHSTRVCERPKVIYNAKNNNFVMWMHLDDRSYSYARGGVAVSDSPTGPFTFLGARHCNRKDTRDMTLFQDNDGKAYLIHSGDWNKSLYISQLNDDFTDFTGRFTKTLIDQEREAPAFFYHDGMYYAVTSGCTGWSPNSALYAESEHLLNGAAWKLIDNPCTGENYRRTFEGQSAHIFSVNNNFYLLLDHWKPDDLKTSGYSILPVKIRDGIIEIPWCEEPPLMTIG